MVLFIIIGIFFEVRGNNESLDTIFKGHIVWLIIVKKIRLKKIDYFFTRDLFSLKSLLALWFAEAMTKILAVIMNEPSLMH